MELLQPVKTLGTILMILLGSQGMKAHLQRLLQGGTPHVRRTGHP